MAALGAALAQHPGQPGAGNRRGSGVELYPSSASPLALIQHESAYR